MTRAKAQLTMRETYLNGGPGVCISGAVWLLAADLVYMHGFKAGMIAFFLGGIFIHPTSIVAVKAIRKAPPPSPPDKGLVQLSVLTLPILFGGLYLAYILSAQNQNLFYPVMAAAIGLRYLIFQRIYGLQTFVALGVILIAIGIGSHFLQIKLIWVPVIVGITELLFGLWLVRKPIDEI